MKRPLGLSTVDGIRHDLIVAVIRRIRRHRRSALRRAIALRRLR